MNFLSGFPHFEKNRGNRTRLLLHGELIHCFNDQQFVVELTQEAIQKTVGGTSRSIVFLASPFIHTFIHETIHLSKNEMEKADQQLLGFKNPAANYINITSLKLNEKKSITIHSHLTQKGAELLKTLQHEKIRFTWHPAILSLVTNLFQDGIEQLKAKFADRAEMIDALIVVYDEYRPFQGRLDDPKDLQRMLKGAGILEFRILPTQGHPEADADEMARYVETLKTNGPKYASDNKYVWCEIENTDEYISL